MLLATCGNSMWLKLLSGCHEPYTLTKLKLASKFPAVEQAEGKHVFFGDIGDGLTVCYNCSLAGSKLTPFSNSKSI